MSFPNTADLFLLSEEEQIQALKSHQVAVNMEHYVVKLGKPVGSPAKLIIAVSDDGVALTIYHEEGMTVCSFPRLHRQEGELRVEKEGTFVRKI